MHKQLGWPQPGEDCQEKVIHKCLGPLKGVDWSWSYCIKSTHTQTDPGHGLQMSYSSCQAAAGLLLSGPKFSFQMKPNFASHWETNVPESGRRMERHTIQDAWSPVWSFHSQFWFGDPCHLYMLVHCALLSPVIQPSTRTFWSISRFLFADELYGNADFNFHQDFETFPHYQKYQNRVKWIWDNCGCSKLAWDKPRRESMGHCQEKEMILDQTIQKDRSRYLSILVFHLSSTIG